MIEKEEKDVRDGLRKSCWLAFIETMASTALVRHCVFMYIYTRGHTEDVKGYRRSAKLASEYRCRSSSHPSFAYLLFAALLK